MAGNKLLNVIRQSARIPAGENTDILVGTVTSVSPLKVKIENRLEIPEQFISLTSMVTDFSVPITLENETKQYTIHLGLNVGENVLLLRGQQGQKYIIIDRLR